jgi:hypothetical protein
MESAPGGSGVPVLVPALLWVGRVPAFPRGPFPASQSAPQLIFFAFRLQWRTACVSVAATRRIVALFSRNFSERACRHSVICICHSPCQLHLMQRARAQTDMQTRRQTDRQIMVHAMPCHAMRRGSWWKICGTPCHAMPCHAMPRCHGGADLKKKFIRDTLTPIFNVLVLTWGSLWGSLLRGAERENQAVRWPQMESVFSKCLKKQN